MLHGGVKFGNAIVDVSIKSGFYPDIVMGGAEPLAELHRAGLVRADARVFARNAGLALVVRKGNPLGIASPKDLLRPEVTIVLASDVEPGARAQYRRAPGALIGESAAAELFTRELVTFDGRLGIQHRDVPGVGKILRQCRHHFPSPGAVLCAHVSSAAGDGRNPGGRALFLDDRDHRDIAWPSTARGGVRGVLPTCRARPLPTLRFRHNGRGGVRSGAAVALQRPEAALSTSS